MVGFQVKKATREKIFVKVALMAPSGGGKTFSALRLATGMSTEIEKQTGKKAKILLANTEQKRGYYYANEFTYDIVDIEAPHNPEKYVDLINFAIEEKYDILILDSTSHEWEGKGGCLELHVQAGGTYQSWGKVTPRHDKFIHAIADSKLHVIATMRGKDQYEMDKDDKGKASVKKLGVGAQQRSGFEYEFTCTFLLDQKTNMADVQKDNTHIFESDGSLLLSEKHGEKMIQWANSGEGYTDTKRGTTAVIPTQPTSTDNQSTQTMSTKTNSKSTNKTTDDLTNIKTKIGSLVTELVKIDKDQTLKVLYEYIKKADGTPSNNYNSIQNIELAKTVLAALESLQSFITNNSNQEGE